MKATRKICMAGLVLAIIGMSVVWSTAAFAQVIELEESVIKGRIQKPEAFYILQHSELDYEELDPKKSFLPELLETVQKEPF